MKIALCQFEIAYEEKQINLQWASGFIEMAARQGGDMILFPEMSFTGFSMNTVFTGEDNAGGFHTVERIKEQAIQNHIAIGFGWVETQAHRKEIARAKNHYTVVDRNGAILADYVKMHPFRYAKEDMYFEAGDKPVLFSYQGICFGMAICYDLRFPELFAYLSKKAHVILVPANWPARRAVHWRTLLQARAIEDQCYMIGVNCFGKQQGIAYTGNSGIITPKGEWAFELEQGEELRLYDLIDDVDEVREEFPVKMDRRENLYRTFYE